MNRRARQATVQGIAESDVTEHTHIEKNIQERSKDKMKVKRVEENLSRQ